MLRLVDLSFDIYDNAPTFDPDPETHVRAHLKISDLNYNITEADHERPLWHSPGCAFPLL